MFMAYLIIFILIPIFIAIVELMDLKDAYVEYLRAKAEYYRKRSE